MMFTKEFYQSFLDTDDNKLDLLTQLVCVPDLFCDSVSSKVEELLDECSKTKNFVRFIDNRVPVNNMIKGSIFNELLEIEGGDYKDIYFGASVIV